MGCRGLCARKPCSDLCFKKCRSACDRKDLSPPPPLLSAPNGQNQNHAMSTGIILMISMIGTVMLFGILCTILKLYNLRRKRSRRRNSPILFETQETFLDENRGPENSEIEHHIWYINTIGLQQSVIEAITVCKYKKDEGLIDGTECSICLGEFEEDDSLRLLPKCSHAFHLPCIDTWLRSHKNCPLCRAPIVRDAGSANFGVVQPNFNDSGSNEDVEVENFENNIELGGDQVVEVTVGDGDSGALPIADQTFDRNPKRVLPNSIARNSDCQVLSDLAHNRRVVEEDMQPVRRSVSLDSSSAKMIYLAVANAIPDKDRGASNKNLDLKSASKRGSGSSSIYKLMKSYSIGRSLQKGPVSMKRSFSSSSGKFLSSRHSKSQDSILPL